MEKIEEILAEKYDSRVAELRAYLLKYLQNKSVFQTSNRTDKDIKDQAEVIFSELGLNMTTAINMFLRTIIRENGIPFNLKLEIPNNTTIAAIKEGKEIVHDKKVKGYSNMNDLRKALEVWNMR